ncbi:peptidylprolyl isomerase [Caulobacter segnis]|uniref:peptidylprolyl isomerase n=2 Tax=Caulobacter segnis TaxID=88688 RepID=D5VMN4_CAUST|nr:peptidylprolyl isomerase [Caulobacter segnis]ADG11757.1 peptidyl-prolyl cis-trans isomerase cyclophilin type [Caulobacter segnis ATCC 21756]AVQ03398.1 peptidylprolyl isomerase [Caulobacter segnis]
MTVSKIARRALVGALAMLAASPALAAGKPRVAIETDKGTIVVELEDQKAPITAKNFLYYVDKHRFDGGQFFRANRAKGAPGAGSIQGQPKPYSRRAPPIAHESTLKTGLKHKAGAISMGRDAPGSATADFFICASAQPYLDAKPGKSDAAQGYAVFGYVVQGMDVVKKILAGRTDGQTNVPSMKGQILNPPVKILSMKRV